MVCIYVKRIILLTPAGLFFSDQHFNRT